MTEKKIEDITRAQIAARLPDAIMHALNEYHDFSQKRNDTEAKDFGDHHRACKTAIGHIQDLIKLAEWAHLDAPGTDGSAGHEAAVTRGLVSEARREVEAFIKRETPCLIKDTQSEHDKKDSGDTESGE